MSNYNGIFLRSALGQGNELPRKGPQNMSPDILLLGIAPVADPAIFAQHYDQAFNKPLLAAQANYIYLRGKNYSNQPINDEGDTRPRLFWTKASLLMWPQTWTELIAGPSGQALSLKAGPGSVGVTNQPYVWTPQNISNDHYCLIAVVPSPGYDNRIPDNQISDFPAFVATHGGIAWTDVTVENAKTLTISGKAMFFEMGDESADIQFTIVCTNVPVGCTVSFSAGTPGTNPAIYLPPTPVTAFPNFSAGLTCSVPAGYVSDIYYNLVVPQGLDISNARINIMAAYTTGANASQVLASNELKLQSE
ncbi:hypothetical protein [Taibaiella koreensis]|uniref:hypothetical protein n=1 Tax=Taibaiella koreensis TaxID=1268548 RepID=UPI000E59A2B2|nr:hypothetical protein [Taibaiella koreensis]